jgi:5'-nucleotidase
VAAPHEQSSGMGRSLPSTSTGIITEQKLHVNGQEWNVYAVGGSPAQAVQHGVLEIMAKRKPDLVVSGINYGENVGLGTTISGTVGAAMEAAALGIPALAISLEAAQRYHLSYSQEVNFSVAAHFTAFFSRILLARKMPEDVHLLKVDVPSDASPETPWVLTRVARQGYYEPIPPQRQSWNIAARLGYREAAVLDGEDEDSDVVVLRKHHKVAVTPISLDLSSRVDLDELQKILRR